MKIFRKKLVRQENMGVIDRSVRVFVGCLLIIPLVFNINNISPILLDGMTYAIVGVFYLMLTGMLGWDPIYKLFDAKTCSISKRNPCGSYMYQLRALLGRQSEKDPGYQTQALKPGEHTTGTDAPGNWL